MKEMKSSWPNQAEEPQEAQNIYAIKYTHPEVQHT